MEGIKTQVEGLTKQVKGALHLGRPRVQSLYPGLINHARVVEPQLSIVSPHFDWCDALASKHTCRHITPVLPRIMAVHRMPAVKNESHKSGV